MKKNLTKLLAVGSLGLLLLQACKKDGAQVTSNGGKAGALTASVTTLPLDKTKIGDPTMVISFNFTKANYGYTAAVTNTLQIDVPGDNWKNPTSATLATNVYSQGYSTADFNNLVLKLNVPADVATPIVARIQQSISSSIAPVYSNVLSLNVTAFNLTSWLYITGAFAQWQNPGPLEDSLVSVTGNGVYVGVINFNATGSGYNNFLILPAKNWSNKYGTTQPTTLSPSSTVTYNASNNLNAPTTNGQYIVTFNLNTGTISFAAADYYSIIGSSTPGGNWSTDLFLKFVNDGNNNWMGTFPMLAGEYKFRLDDQWTTSWGPGATAGTAVTSGATGDGNIQLSPAGTYTFTLNQPPTVVGSSNGPLGTATFTAVKQ